MELVNAPSPAGASFRASRGVGALGECLAAWDRAEPWAQTQGSDPKPTPSLKLPRLVIPGKIVATDPPARFLGRIIIES